MGFRVLGFRVLGFRVLGFRVLGFRGLGFRVWGICWVLSVCLSNYLPVCLCISNYLSSMMRLEDQMLRLLLLALNKATPALEKNINPRH